MLRALRTEMHRVIVGQDQLIDGLLIGLLCSGHVLLEGVPGLAKTLCVTTLAEAMDVSFSRVQFTPDLLPGDLTGSQIYNPATGEFRTRRGPIFANLLLADEVNRAPAKVQSALLEAMQERQVTIGEKAHPLPEPFMVIATQNPIEQEGTYPLPEAQLDRFMLKLRLEYPERGQEIEIVDRMAVTSPIVSVEKVLHSEDIVRMRRTVDGVRVDDRLKGYVLDLVQASRTPPPELELGDLIEWGASPRASIYLVMAARARAMLDGRTYANPDDVQAVAANVLRHRIILTFEAEAEALDTDSVIDRLLAHVPVP